MITVKRQPEQKLIVPEFDEATHKYTLDGRELPSVTAVLKDVGLIDPSRYAPGSAERGKAIHLACQLWDEGDLDEETLDPAIRPYLDGWIKFRRDSRIIFDLIEKPLADFQRRYCGTPDRVSLKIILDIKTGMFESWHPLQSAAYLNMIPGAPCLERWAVYLQDDGGYTMRIFPKTTYFSELNHFLTCLNFYNLKRIYGH